MIIHLKLVQNKFKILALSIVIIFAFNGCSNRAYVSVHSGEDSDGQYRTHVDLRHITVPFSDARTSNVQMFGGFTYLGQNPVPPNFVSLVFVARPSKPIYTDNPEVLILFDGNFIEVTPRSEDVNKYGSSFRNLEPYLDSDWLGIYIPNETFVRIANSKTVSIQNGSIEFQLSEENLEALRDLASRIAN